MVRENFALFLRCADGIDVFNERTLSQSGPGLVDRLNRLDVSAESGSPHGHDNIYFLTHPSSWLPPL
jgi:hypothetical protein